jgi:signal transduction histidine kinase
MKSGLAEGLAFLDRCLEWTSGPSALTDGDQLASQFARGLLELWPEASLAACRLQAAGQSGLAVCSRDDQANVKTLSSDAGQAMEQAARQVSVPTGHSLRRERLTAVGEDVELAVILPHLSADDESLVQRVLRCGCRQLACRLERESLRAQVGESQLLADLAVLAGPMTHEFNNFINIVLLQAAILEAEAPEDNREELTKLRQHGKAVTHLIQDWHRYRSRLPLLLQSIDLNAAIQQTIAAWEPTRAEKVRLELAQDLPAVSATAADMHRVLRFLIGNALSAASSVTVRTSASGEAVFLRLEDDGLGLDPDRLNHLFEPVLLRKGTVPLELAACESIVRRRWQGRIGVENRPEGGLAISIQLRPAPRPPS